MLEIILAEQQIKPARLHNQPSSLSMVIMFLLNCFPNFFLFQVPPKLQHFDFGDEPANFGDSASIMCLVLSGDTPIDINWLFNDYPINSYMGITIVKGGKKSSMLTIESVTGRHSGNYSCQAKNTAATVSQSAQLIVNGYILYVFASKDLFYMFM